MNILVTGGAGFIGSYLIKHLLLRKEIKNIIVIDKLTYAGNLKNIPLDKVKFIKMGIEDPNIKDILIENKIDLVFNLAANTHVDRSIRNPLEFVETDILGTINLLLACMKTTKAKFVHMSTDEVYGSILEGEADESYPLKPCSPYSASKASADLILLSYIKTYNYPIMILRACNNYGNAQYPEKLIPLTIIRLLNNQKAILHGEGKEIREWIPVYACSSIIASYGLKSKFGEIYNIGSGIRKTNYEVVSKIISLIKPNENIEDYILRTPNRPGNDVRYAITKTNPCFFPDLCLKDIIKWYKNNPNYWENIDFDANIYKSNEGYLR